MSKSKSRVVLLNLIGASLLLSSCGNSSSSTIVNTSDSSSSSEETSSSSSSVQTVCSLSLVYDDTLLTIKDVDGGDLLKEYDNGATVSFKVTSKDPSYNNILVSVNGVDWTASSGVYSFSITSNTIIHVNASIISYSVSTVSQDVKLVFTDSEGKELESQKGSYLGGQSAYFKLENKAQGGFLGIHNIVVSDGSKTLTADAKGVYAISNINADQMIDIAAALHSFNSDGKEKTTGASAQSLLFTSSLNCTITYTDGLGYKVQANDPTSGYEIRFDPSVVSYYLSKNMSAFTWKFGNGSGFVESYDSSKPNPINCAMEWYAYDTNETKVGLFTKAIGDQYTRPSAWGAVGAQDLCTCSLALLDSYADIRLYIAPTDAAGDTVGASYIYSAAFSILRDCVISETNEKVKLIFTDSTGVALDDQTGSYSKGDDAYFKLSSAISEKTYLAFHNIVVKNGDDVLSTDANGVYSIKSIQTTCALSITGTAHAFNDEGKETTTGLSAAHYLFGTSSNCTVTYVDNIGWKIDCVDTTSGYEIVFDPAVVSYYLSKNLPFFSWTFGNGSGFVESYDSSKPNPINCAMEWYAYDSTGAKVELFPKAISGSGDGTRPSAWGPAGTQDLCTCSLALFNTYNDIKLYINSTDAAGDTVGSSYIYSATFAKLHYLVSETSENVNLVFTDSTGTALADQSGSYCKDDDVYFKLANLAESTYFAFHNILVKNGDDVLSADANGVYSIKSIQAACALSITGTAHAFNDEGKETTTGQTAQSLLFASSKNCTVTYTEGLGYKIEAIDKTSGYEIAFDPAVVSYYLSKNLPCFSWTFGNGSGFVESYDSSKPNPVNCAMEWYAYDSAGAKVDLFPKAISGSAAGTRPSAWGPAGTQDLCTCSLALLNTYNDIKLYINSTDAAGDTVGASYIYTASFDAPVANKDYFEPDTGVSCDYVDGQGWKFGIGPNGNSFNLKKDVITYHYQTGSTKLKLIFGPAFAGETCTGHPEQCTIVVHAYKKDGSQADYKTAWIHTLTDEGDSKYSLALDLNDADWDFVSHPLKFYASRNDITGTVPDAIFIYGVDFS